MLGHHPVRKTLVPQQHGVHANDQHLLVVRAIKNPDLSPFRHYIVAAPQKIMIQFFVGRGFKRMDVAALWIHAGHHVLHGAVLARRVHPLKDQQHRPAILGIELLLHLARQGTVLFRQFLGVLLGFHTLALGWAKSFRWNLLPFVMQKGSASRVASLISFRSFISTEV